MSARPRTLSTKYGLPPKPEWIQILTSDGDRSTWPANTTRIVDAEGHVNFMDPVDYDHPICKKWQVEVGRAIALAKELPSKLPYVRVVSSTNKLAQLERIMSSKNGQRIMQCMITTRARQRRPVTISIFLVRLHAIEPG